MQIFLHRACWAAKRGDKIFGVLRHDLLWSLSANLQEYQQIATFRIFRRVRFERTSNAMFCNFPLNFAVWPQPSRFLKAEIQICAFLRGLEPCLRGFAPCLCAYFGPECISLLLKNCQWDWREKNSSKFALKLLKFSATAAELRVDFHLKTGWRWQNHGIDFESPRPDQALKPLIIWWTFPWEIWFTNIVDMIVPLYATSALSALFGILWVVLPKKGSQSKK